MNFKNVTADWNTYRLKEIEAESRHVDDEDLDTLRGIRIPLVEPWTGRRTIVSEQTIQAEMKKRDMWEIPCEYRGPVYSFLQNRLKEAIRGQIREKVRKYSNEVEKARIGRWEIDYNYVGTCTVIKPFCIKACGIYRSFYACMLMLILLKLKGARIIGMTTTGLSKYRGLIQSLNPKIVMIGQ